MRLVDGQPPRAHGRFRAGRRLRHRRACPELGPPAWVWGEIVRSARPARPLRPDDEVAAVLTAGTFHPTSKRARNGATHTGARATVIFISP
jgi:hypothetical protein